MSMVYGDLREKLNAKKKKFEESMSSASKPKLCKVCNRASFLKCLDCDAIYCSATCQIQDWEDHQYAHSKSRQNSMQRQPLQMKPANFNYNSVQDRLKKAVERPNKNVDQPGRPAPSKAVDLEAVCEALKSVSLAETPHPLVNQDSAVDAFRKILSIRKFKRHVQLTEESKDHEGFSFVFVSEVEEKTDDTFVYWVVPFELKQSWDDYKNNLNSTYEAPNIPTIPKSDVAKFRHHLVIAKIQGKWCRAIILNLTAGIISIEDIDSGLKAIRVLDTTDFKQPQEPDLLKSGYAFQVLLENVSGKGLVEQNDLISIRISGKSSFGYSTAEVKMKDPSEVMETEKQEKKNTTHTRNSIDQLQVKGIHTGIGIRLIYCDGSEIEKGKMHVCESLSEHLAFYDSLAKKIEDHVKANPSARGYKPVTRELVLAKFSVDNCFYRGACLNVSDLDAKVHFIDYGSESLVEIKDIYQLPASFLFTCCSHTVEFQLTSGRSINGIDGEETRELLVNKSGFDAKVERISLSPQKYKITIDDSLVVFKADK